MVLGAGLRHLHDAEDAGEALLEQPVLGLVAVHEADSLDVDLRVVAVVDLHARRRRAVAAGEARREEAGAVAGLRPPEPDTDLVLRLLLPTRRRRRLGGRLVLPPRLVGGRRWLVGHGRRGLD